MSNRQLIPKNAYWILTPKQVRDNWEKFAPGLRIVQEKNGWVDWKIEDVYHMLMSGEAAAMALPEQWRGFVIFTRLETFRGSILWVWAAHGERRTDIMAYWEALHDLASNENINLIQWASARCGFTRAMKRYRAKMVGILYETEVQ